MSSDGGEKFKPASRVEEWCSDQHQAREKSQREEQLELLAKKVEVGSLEDGVVTLVPEGIKNACKEFNNSRVSREDNITHPEIKEESLELRNNILETCNTPDLSTN